MASGKGAGPRSIGLTCDNPQDLEVGKMPRGGGGCHEGRNSMLVDNSGCAYMFALARCVWGGGGYIPKNDRHVALMTLRYICWGKNLVCRGGSCRKRQRREIA